jgi:hypothetical protein
MTGEKLIALAVTEQPACHASLPSELIALAFHRRRALMSLEIASG